MLLLYLGTSLIIWLAFRQVRSTIEAMKLREFDHQMGALFGAAKGFILACVVTLFAVTLLHENQRQTIMHSQSGYLIARFLNNTAPFMPQEVRNFLGPYLDRLELDRLERRLESYPGGLQADPGYPVPNSTYPSGNYAQPGYPQLPSILHLRFTRRRALTRCRALRQGIQRPLAQPVSDLHSARCDEVGEWPSGHRIGRIGRSDRSV